MEKQRYCIICHRPTMIVRKERCARCYDWFHKKGMEYDPARPVQRKPVDRTCSNCGTVEQPQRWNKKLRLCLNCNHYQKTHGVTRPIEQPLTKRNKWLLSQNLPLPRRVIVIRSGYRKQNAASTKYERARWRRQSQKQDWDERKEARYQLNKAIRNGLIIRPARCPQCLKTAQVNGHHYDYNRPLDVQWLCHQCHSQEHPPYERARAVGQED